MKNFAKGVYSVMRRARRNALPTPYSHQRQKNGRGSDSFALSNPKSKKDYSKIMIKGLSP